MSSFLVAVMILKKEKGGKGNTNYVKCIEIQRCGGKEEM